MHFDTSMSQTCVLKMITMRRSEEEKSSLAYADFVHQAMAYLVFVEQ